VISPHETKLASRWTLADYLNDSPIEDFGDDRYRVGPFAKALARSFLKITKPVGTTIALHGPWGSGKSSVVNLVKCELVTANDEKLVVSDFKCWWFRGEEALALAFMQELNAILKGTLGSKVDGMVPGIARAVLQAGPIVGPAIATATGNPWLALLGLSNFGAKFFPKGQTVEKIFSKLSAVLAEHDRRFLIIIDDIDRLGPQEAMAIFRMVKSVGRLPNVMYLLVFDRELADNAVATLYPSEGPHFLEKIIQAGFELPMPLQSDLNTAVLSTIEEICGSPNEDLVQRIMNVFYDAVVPYLTTPRHVGRFRNAIGFTWPAIANEVCVADFIVLETLRLYEPELFRHIRAHKDKLCGTRGDGEQGGRDDTRFEPFLRGVSEKSHETAKLALMRLFPRLEGMGYSNDFVREWDAERRVCVEKHFDTYFRLALSEEVLSTRDIEDLIQGAGDRIHVQTIMRRAAKTKRNGGQSMVPVYLDELTTHARKVRRESVATLLTALFEVHDEIDLEEDAERGFMAMANTSLRYHWLIRRLTADRFTLEERTQAYLAATENAALGWMVEFVSSARHDYFRNGDPGPKQQRLVTEAALNALTECALRAIEDAAQDGSLLRHKDLMSILFRWRDFSGNPQAVRNWTNMQISKDDAVVILAGRMTGQSWSFGMGGFGALGDRVSRPTTRAKVDGIEEIIDVDQFRTLLQRIDREAKLDAGSLATVRTFLQAWDRRLQGRDG
jgi:predicted KAP-like P-loop ATPase